jgi:hypothetical protein
MLDLSQYDFVDFGCSSGGSLEFGASFFGGRGVGLDIDEAKVKKAQSKGFDVRHADVSALDPATIGRTGFVIMSHFLEHLPKLGAAAKCITSACKVARDFVLIQQPSFDADPYLFNYRLKTYWSDWRGHSLPMTTLQLYRMTQPHVGTLARRVIICGRYRIEGSRSPEIHPLASPGEQHKWDGEVHPPKPDIHFTFPVYRETCAIILTGLESLSPELEKYLKKCEVLWDSDLH